MIINWVSKIINKIYVYMFKFIFMLINKITNPIIINNFFEKFRNKVLDYCWF